MALALHQFGEKVTLLDADTTASNIGLQLGYYSFPTKLQDVLKDEAHIDEATYTHPSGLKIIPSSIDMGSLDTNLDNINKHIQKLDGIVIIDSPPGLNEDAINVLKASDEIIVVTNPELPTIANAVKVIKKAGEFRKPVLGIAINRNSYDEYAIPPEEVELMCESHVISKIPEENSMKRCIFEKTPLVHNLPYAPASIEYKKLAAKIIGKTYEPPKFLFLRRLMSR